MSSDAPAEPASRPIARSAAVSVEDLLSAKRMAGNLRGTEKTIAAPQAWKRFEG